MPCPTASPTADALRQEIVSIYGDKLAEGCQTFRVVFHIAEEDSEAS